MRGAIYLSLDDSIISGELGWIFFNLLATRPLNLRWRWAGIIIGIKFQFDFKHKILLTFVIFALFFDWLPDSLPNIGKPVGYLPLLKSRFLRELISTLFLQVRIISVLNEPFLQNRCLIPRKVLFPISPSPANNFNLTFFFNLFILIGDYLWLFFLFFKYISVLVIKDDFVS